MNIYVEKINDICSMNDGYKIALRREAKKKVNLNNENIIKDIEKFLTTDELSELYPRLEDFEIQINVDCVANGIFGKNKFNISKGGDKIFLHLNTHTFIYKLFSYNFITKEIFEGNIGTLTTTMPNFLFAKLFFEELELIALNESKVNRIKTIYHYNKY